MIVNFYLFRNSSNNSNLWLHNSFLRKRRQDGSPLIGQFCSSKCSLISQLDCLAVEQCFGNKWQRRDWLIVEKNNRALIGPFRGSIFRVFNFESQLPGCGTVQLI